MSELKFIVRGYVVGEHAVKAHLDKGKPRASNSLKTVTQRDEAKESLGFVVLGYSPEHMEECALAYKLDQAGSQTKGLTREEFTAKWMSKNKPKRARSNPYGIASSAEKCAEMMRKAGWLHVRVDEILKG